jgi:hypothetical protein
MSRKLTVALGVAVTLMGASLKVVLGYDSALFMLLVGLALVIYVTLARNEDADENTFFSHLRDTARESDYVSPLEILFDSNNPARRFWSMESGAFWEYRVEIRNNSAHTLRNVCVSTEHTGQMPIRPTNQAFDKSKKPLCDLQPLCSELIPVIRWPIQRQPGMLTGPTALDYGPLKVIARADNVKPAVRVFAFDYQSTPMLSDYADSVVSS